MAKVQGKGKGLWWAWSKKRQCSRMGKRVENSMKLKYKSLP
jgi:hypothetical protein